MRDSVMNGAARWQAVRRILAVRLDHLGDVLMTTPALAAIRASQPQARLSMLCSPSGAEAAMRSRLVDEVIPFRAPWMKHTQPDALSDCAARLRAGRFDAAVIFTTCTQSALPAAMLCLLADIPLRLAHSREQPYQLLTDWVRETDEVRASPRHEVDRQLALVAHVGWRPHHDRLRFELDEADEARARTRLRAHGLADGVPYVVMHPGASAPSRRYPAERFGRVADQLWQRRGVRTVFTGSMAEADVVAQARQAMQAPSLNLCGELNLGELGGILSDAALLVSNNTGPVHLATALDTPVVDLYALTNPQHTPWKARARVLSHDVPCRDCLQSVCPQGSPACLTGIAPEAVVDACLALLPA